MTLLHFVCKAQAKITPLKLVPAVSCFVVPVSYKSNFSCSYVQKSIRSSVPGILIPTRTFWETFPDTRRYTLFEKDGVDRDHYELVYRSPMFGYVFYTQLISELVLALQMIYGISFVIRSLIGEKFAFFENATVPLVFDSLGFGILSYFTFQTAVLYLISHRTVLRIYYSEANEEYIVIFLKTNPFVTQQLRCKPGDLIQYPHSLLSVLFGSFRLKGKRIVMNLTHFKNPFYYNHLLGHVQ